MSADNYIIIDKVDGKYVGIMLFASDSESESEQKQILYRLIAEKHFHFSCNTLEEAIAAAQREPVLEYGFTITVRALEKKVTR